MIAAVDRLRGERDELRARLRKMKSSAASDEREIYDLKRAVHQLGEQTQAAQHRMQQQEHEIQDMSAALQQTRHLSDKATPQFRLLDPAFDASQMSEPVRRVLALQNASTADATKARSRAVAAAFRQHDADCGSTRVQVARLTVELEALAAHVAAHPKDKHSTRGYQLKISKRRRLLAYLKRRNPGDYEATLQALGLPTPKEGKKRRRARL